MSCHTSVSGSCERWYIAGIEVGNLVVPALDEGVVAPRCTGRVGALAFHGHILANPGVLLCILKNRTF